MGYQSKNLHYVSQFYLRKFAFNLDNPKDEPSVFQMTKKGMIPDEPNTVKSICSKNNYNTRQQEIEQSQRESRYSDVGLYIVYTAPQFRMLTEDDFHVLCDTYCDLFSLYLAIAPRSAISARA